MSSGGRWASHQTGGAARLLLGPSQARSALLPAPREGEEHLSPLSAARASPVAPRAWASEWKWRSARSERSAGARTGPGERDAPRPRLFCAATAAGLADVSRQNDRSHGSWGAGSLVTCGRRRPSAAPAPPASDARHGSATACAWRSRPTPARLCLIGASMNAWVETGGGGGLPRS